MKVKCILAVCVAAVVWCAVSGCDKQALSSVDARVKEKRDQPVKTIQNYDFDTLDNYVYIDITRTDVSTLCSGMIKNFLRLHSLMLIDLNITLIEPQAFQNLPKLTHLSLSTNLITHIPAETFNELKNLKTLYLSRNNIRSIENGAFSNMPYLKAVYLEHNEISELSGEIFYGSTKLSYLDVSFNRFTKIEKSYFADVKPGPDVRALHLFLKKNEIVSVESGTFNYTVPLNLHLEHNNLTDIPDLLYSLVEDSKLYLDNNKVGCVTNDPVDYVSTRNILINLPFNPITCLCQHFFYETVSKKYLIGEINVGSNFCLENSPTNNL